LNYISNKSPRLISSNQKHSTIVLFVLPSEVLVEVMAQIAGAAPKTPFYYYDINFCTGLYSRHIYFLCNL